MVMCDTSKYNKEPTETNHRRACAAVMERAAATVPWFGMEQEYTLLDTDGESLVMMSVGMVTIMRCVVRSPAGLAQGRVPRASGSLLLRGRGGPRVRAGHRGGALQGLPLRRHQGQRGERRGREMYRKLFRVSQFWG